MADEDSFMDVMRDYSIDPSFAHLHDFGEWPVYDKTFTEPHPKVCFLSESGWRVPEAELVAHIGLPRDELYFTSIVKYRTPALPSAQVIASSLPYLRRELRLVQPLTFCVLDVVSLRALVPDSAAASTTHLTRYRTRQGKPVLALYDPLAKASRLTALTDWLREDFE